MNVNTPAFDTILLYIFSYLSGLSLLLGIACLHKITPLTEIECWLKEYILSIYFFIVFAIPLCFKLFGIKLIRDSIAKKMKKSEFKYYGDCPKCGAKQVLLENNVINWNDLRICGSNDEIGTIYRDASQ